ncbi:AQG_2a_G0026430.mRNA.1.CDS.1 [Saccharomyces cerevisiae]|uniref:SNF2-family ATP dependent chromatin remodeling factor snf21 n=1 Tax=Saccharomyces cerevisiae (strain RM11-1a) TaxID=285006 RepID=B3LTX3_YEAS1|nr:Sth1p [Saccharomyces cerevisiae YJM1078]AJR36643.1 Sth1p [Saccharomyces cerevisiae YJM189]AJR37177.1 Sth1p [Saccharomyces cerevisiae YJM244]AJR37953.1 Sth1p [Saccharomyces cerevisiae YJM320]AJR38902.1 Sth1p [Saccharomyces cerevisiae YJM453]AJR39474.1 Sth1p [Saccharomyces cerevisiae YJM541]AJR39653.1 Sth1p [Saccharomyces cerevisiae YJM554]AJR39833.1 Sth1p [Saccharomyces cerevisiae YJM555]AJR40024.1 Sth1p [Saccharomyces cerevisiae YJM627]AJR40599.1 Sth1p [Saccharomyces cerevisiae YJM683]
MLQEQSELMSTVMNNTPTTVAALAAVAAASETNGKLGSEEQPEITIPKPRSSAQLEQLLYRYRAIQNHPKENKLEIKAIEDTFRNISRDQDIYETKLDTLRKSIDKGFQYDEDLLNKHLVALQLLEKDTDVPDYFLDLPDTKNDNTTAIEVDYSEKKPIKISADFNAKAKSLGLESKFSNATKTALGDPDTEIRISARISNRINELERLPANLGTYSLDDCLEFITKDDLSSRMDTFKIKALVELKSLKLLTKQKSIRQKLINNVASQAHHNIPYLRDSPFTAAAQRSVQIRSKVIVPQTVRLAEELERQQLLEKRKKERNLHLQKINSIIDFIKERQSEQWSRQERCFQFGRLGASLHNQMEKDEQKRIERTAKQRLAALKSNDEEAYLKLLDQTKDTRITQLLRQTNSFLDSLSEAVRAQQNEAKILHGEEVQPITDEEREKTDYYEVAHRIKEKIDKQPSILVGGTLKEYQLRGLEWMVSLYNNHLNGILADEMGLGKTIQSISLITYLYEVKKDIGPFLVIVPLSTITNWTLEFEKWAPSLNTIIYKGTPNQRHSLQHQIRIGNFDVLLTTYEYIIKDKSLLSKHDWAHMIIDEGHRMKNAQSKLSFTISHYYRTRNRLILTGTPLQNNLPELWALLNFVLPKIFNSAKTFEDWFNTPFANTGTQEKLELTEEETLLIIRRLHKVLRPFLLRRLKKEVEKDLPDKVEKVIKCKLSGLQQQLYQQMLKHNALFVGAGTEGATKGGIKGLNNKIMQLRKICNHPFVFDEVEGVVNPSRGNSDLLFRVAGKFELLDRVLPKFKASGHRVLMFFQMTQVMDIMEDFLRMKDLKYMRLDGSTKTEERTEMLNAFNAPDSDYFCFLLSTRAGGLGLNLQTADTVIIFDTDWNPHQDLQAQDRAHRIGQKNEVRILRLITTDSVEEVILERAMQKLDIDGKVIQAGKFDNKSTAEEQEAFLRRLIESETNRDDDDKAELDDDELNDTLARSADEKILFDKIDKERMNQERADAKAQGLRVPPPRLIQLDELPKVFREDIEEHFKKEDSEPLGRIRQKKRVYYDDGLTEEQFLEAVEDDNMSLEDAIKKRREARERRRLRQNGTKENEIETLENTPEASETSLIENNSFTAAVDEETNADKETTASRSKRRSSRKKRTISVVTAEDKENTQEESTSQENGGAKVEEEVKSSSVEIINGSESKKKKPKLTVKIKLNKTTVLENNDSKRAEEKPESKSPAKKTAAKKTKTKSKSLGIFPTVEKLVEEMREQLDEVDSHPRTSIFEKLPSKRDYPDYFKVIEKPMAIDIILKNCKNGTYKTLEEVRQALQTMFENARFYNEEGSWVYVDADKLNEFTDEWFKEHSS